MVSYLQVDGLRKSFGDLLLFDELSFGIAEGERIGLIAKNGSGKTSLLLRLVRYLKVLKDGHLIGLTGTWPELEEDAKRKMEHA